MNRQNVIKAAWGNDYPDIGVSEFGWSTHVFFNEDFSYKKFDTEPVAHGVYKIRPISLRGIETNNGWTRIKSIEDLPKEKVNCYFSGYNEIIKEFYVSELQERDNTRLQNLFESKYLTHILIVEPTPKPKPPLYL